MDPIVMAFMVLAVLALVLVAVALPGVIRMRRLWRQYLALEAHVRELTPAFEALGRALSQAAASMTETFAAFERAIGAEYRERVEHTTLSDGTKR